MNKPIAAYGLIGDTHSNALICDAGSIDWLCWPRHDSPALFTRLLDAGSGGHAAIRFDGLASVGRRYIPGTNILETSFAGDAGAATLTDLMPVHPPSTEQDDGPDGFVQSRLLRRVTCDSGRARGELRLSLTPDFGRARATFTAHDDGIDVRVPNLDLHAHGSHPLRVEGQSIVMRFDLAAGEAAFLALACDGVPDVCPTRTLDDAENDIRHTAAYWQRWCGNLKYEGRYRDAMERSALVLKALTYSPTGGIVAAATTSLPEAVPGNRNFDYRYSWVRDASFTVTAFCNLGQHREAEEYIRFLRNADGTKGRELHLLYPVDGEIPPETELDHLPGWRGVGPVRIGNAASDQHQYDLFGEFMVALLCYVAATDFDPPPRIAKGLVEAITTIADRALGHRHDKDHGIWEFRDRMEHFQYTKAMIWVALDRACRLAEGLGGFDPTKVAEWRDAATEIRAEYERETWSESRQAYVQSYDCNELDASVLRTALFDALDPRSPRVASTLRAIERELSMGDLTWRYRMPDGLEGDEGTFTACAFWRVGVMAELGEKAEAQALYERLLARGNDLGLFAEEIDPHTGEHLGNFPQAFTHMAIINHGIRLETALARGQG
ncbi:glycoside hydrolase family 15 protein [Falsirhodobacter halotolerans]|uniref:glycoside hydrolase family 15 protein n=1 Tax=Falsirhodobacter halotolerans TaxID=1146892 RepID=UPI001FD10CB0|nr:glycoside hydrolase family 15 protein [Falsirhodobacter halotolerans]MCJ8139844.1 glycoside hydrolase family 15 protein [Falsirhodobacter halotolerans]